MFPVSDFNFVVAGIATVAATVGYACTRRLSQTISPQSVEELRQTFDNETRPIEKATTLVMPSEENSMQTTPTLHDEQVDSQKTMAKSAPAATRKDSLKRKIPHDGFDEPEKEVLLEYPHNLANIYPNKRSRTPSSDSEASTPTISSSIILEPTVSSTSDDKDIEIPNVPVEPVPVATPATEPPRTPSPVAEAISPRQSSPTPAPVSPAPMRVATPQPTTPARNVARPPVTPKPFSSPSAGGFAAFAGSKSPFATFGKPKLTDGSSFKSSKSIWSVGDLTTHQNDAEAGDALAPAFKPKPSPSTDAHALSEAKTTTLHPTEKHTQITGEEDEDVELELKGVKLYTMRGDKPFGDGVFGHVKLLSHKKTLEERILFRREPLWKVSMNVRVGPAVTFKYYKEQDTLRLIVTEPVEKTAGSDASSETKFEVVVYALRPGRSCSKLDFRDFAETLTKSPNFKGEKAFSP